MQVTSNNKYKMASFRNITDLSEEPSCFSTNFDAALDDDEGYEDFGSWNPVSIDEITMNSQQFDPQDGVLRSMACADSARDVGDVRGSKLSELDSMEVMRGGGAVSDMSVTLVIDGPLSSFGERKETFVSTTRKAHYYAPMFPVVHMSTHFVTNFDLDTAVFEVEEIMQQQKHVSYRFVPAECTWHCAYLNNSVHCSFAIRIYRLPIAKETGKRNHAIEMQRLDGDGWIFRSIYEQVLRLRDETIELKSVWDTVGTHLPPIPSVVEEPVAASAITEIESVSTVGNIGEVFELPTEQDVKRVLIETLKKGRLSAVVESTQLACSIYGESDLPPLEPIDVECMQELVDIVCKSETCSDWASQHSIWALNSMSRDKSYCDAMLKFERDEFLESIMGLAVEGSYRTAGMRGKCVDLLRNLIAFDDNHVMAVLGRERVLGWMESTPEGRIRE